MARRPRIDVAGGWHHVMNRGCAGHPVFHIRRDAEQFLRLLAEASERFGVELHAYCLMGNHYHLLVHAPKGGLSGFMQHVGRSYTQFLNARLDRDGPVFRGRFHSELVDSRRYLLAASRYIHRNPVDIRPPVALDRYRWSSYRYYAGDLVAPPWLHTEILLPLFGGRSAMRESVEHPQQRLDVAALVRSIHLVLAEDAGVAAPTTTTRVAATAAIDRLPARDAEHLRRELGYATTGALRTAVSRARRRLRLDPNLDEVITRALRLVA